MICSIRSFGPPVVCFTVLAFTAPEARGQGRFDSG
jgi:hypothetical protein